MLSITFSNQFLIYNYEYGQKLVVIKECEVDEKE